MESNLYSTEGRIRRLTYWARMIVATAVNILAQIITVVDPSLSMLCLIIILIVSIFSIIQGFKRMHDVGKSGWYILIPLYNLILAFTEGTHGDNEYGENSKEINPSEDELSNSFMTLLFSTFVACGVCALLSTTKIISSDTVTNAVFIISFATCNLYFLTWKLNNSDIKNPIENAQ